MNSNILQRLWPRLRRALSLEKALPCVGVVVFGGCLTFLIAPDELPALPGGSSADGGGLPMVILDPGHGGRDAGGRGNGVIEKDLTLDLARRTEQLLKMAGFPTALTRTDDRYVSLEDRAQFANEHEHEDTIFVSIHFNKDGASSSAGIETFYAREKVPAGREWTWVGFFASETDEPMDNGENLAGAIQASLATRTEARNRGIRARDLYVVRNVRCPAVLIEGGFMSSPFEAQLLKGEEYRQRIAMGITEGVMAYTKSRPRPNTAPSEPRLADARVAR